jgi:NADP-dependent 3-hydroxy acid dehydrogenase YdfG
VPVTERPTAIVTGGSGGIGGTCVEALLADGYGVVFCGRNADSLDAVQSRLEAELRDRAHPVVGDVADPATAASLVSEATNRFGRLDVVVANAGVYHAATVAETRPDDWSRVLQTNLSAVLWLFQAALPELRKRAGYAVAIGSVSGTQGFSGEAAYGASKRALRIVTEAIVAEEAEHGVRATVIAPGVVRTRMAAFAFGSDEYGQGGTQPGLLAPDDVAKTVMYLLNLSPAVRINEIVLGDSRWAYAS